MDRARTNRRKCPQACVRDVPHCGGWSPSGKRIEEGPRPPDSPCPGPPKCQGQPINPSTSLRCTHLNCLLCSSDKIDLYIILLFPIFHSTWCCNEHSCTCQELGFISGIELLGWRICTRWTLLDFAKLLLNVVMIEALCSINKRALCPTQSSTLNIVRLEMFVLPT